MDTEKQESQQEEPTETLRIVEAGYQLAKEMSGGDNPLPIHLRLILEEFTRRLADKLFEERLLSDRKLLTDGHAEGSNIFLHPARFARSAQDPQDPPG